MNAMDWMVVASAAAAIAWVNWYFFVAGRTASSAVAAGASAPGMAAAVPSVTIVVDGGYSPSTVKVAAGTPVRLVFDRRDTSGCSEEVVFPDFGIRKYLPTGTPTTVEVTPPGPGRYEFMCGMSMLRGALVVEDA